MLSKPTIEDILPYLIPEKRLTKKEFSSSQTPRPISLLESMTEGTPVKKTASLSRQRIEENIETQIQKAKVSYELFIPISQELYESIELRYSVKKSEETIEISVVKDKAISISASKPVVDERDYAILFSYNHEKKGFTVKYQTDDYSNRIEEARQDFTLKIDKFLDTLPKTLMGGILGFTYLGSGKMTRRDDLFGAKALMVDVHESIHTPDEYETRVLTDWILTLERPRYKR